MKRGPNRARRWWLKLRHGVDQLRERVRQRRAARRPIVPLEQVQRRLELLLSALYGAPIPIAPNTPTPPTWLDRCSRAMNASDAAVAATPTTDGASIYLPRELPARRGTADAIARYRLFAVEQAERILRGTPWLAPADDGLVRDLYLVREADAIDARIARDQPGLRAALAQERTAALAGRPWLRRLSRRERAVETIVRYTLAADPALPRAGVDDPKQSLEWARATASALRRERGSYYGIRPARLWGTVNAPLAEPTWRREFSGPLEKPVMRKFSFGRTAANSEAATGRTAEQAQKYSDNDAVSAVVDEEATHQAQSATDSPGGADRRARSGSSILPTDALLLDRDQLDALQPAVWYDEWNAATGSYLRRKAGVRVLDPVDDDGDWAAKTLSEHGALVRKIRHEFERLRSRRALLPRQRRGDDIDVAATVAAMTDRHLGVGGDDRLYMAARPARRGVAIALLVDASGSTKARLGDGRTIVDLERIALLLASEALDALGDRYAAYAFAGQGAENVQLTTLKNFDERTGRALRRRVGTLAPNGFTRLGAAVRHATARLTQESAGHRLLLLLSDGRPNDVDVYQTPYGVEDSRQAIVEARASGVFPFCLTIDANAAEYLPRIFGAAGHTILTRPEQLPTALLGVVRRLLRRG